MDYYCIKYVLIDATYKDGCLIVLTNGCKSLYQEYIKNENKEDTVRILTKLKKYELNPIAGHQRTVYAIKEVYPDAIIQRCLFHIKLQTIMWLPAKREIRERLSNIVNTLTTIKNSKNKDKFLILYLLWKKRYKEQIKKQNKAEAKDKDLKKVMTMIDNAIKDMFHYSEDKGTNRESIFSFKIPLYKT